MNIISEATMDGISMTEIATITGLKKGTLHRMLRDMVDQSLITQSIATKKYRLGPKALVWGSKFVFGQDPSGLLSGYCDMLAASTNLYVFLCRFANGEVYCTYTRQPGNGRNKYFVHVGQKMPLHCSAAAKAILAFQPSHEVDILMSKNSTIKYTDYTKTDLEHIIAELRIIKDSRIAFCKEELEIGVSTISTPVFINKDETFFSISLIGGITYMNQNEESLINALHKIGQEASEQMRITHMLTSVNEGK
jgi:DNA-binding IclR family transcriptional regulator